MPVTPTYPGVYIQEVPSPVRTIIGVSTSVTAFVGYLKKGPMDEAVQIFNFGEFEREFGGLDTDSEISYAIQQFFLNGGTEAWVVRTASGNPASANVQILDGISGSLSFTATASNHGEWGNHLRISIDDTSITNTFNLNVSEFVSSGGTLQLGRTEVFRNLTMSSVTTVINDDSELIQVTADVTANPPLQNGTVSDDLSTFLMLSATNPAVDVTIGTDGPYKATLSPKPTTLAEARSALERAIRASRPANPAFASATVEISNNRLRILAGTTRTNSGKEAGYRVVFTTPTDPVFTELRLNNLTNVSGVLSDDLAGFTGVTNDPAPVAVTIGGVGPAVASITGRPADLDAARTALETAIRAANADPTFTGAQVVRVGDRLLILPGTAGDVITVTAWTDPTATELRLVTPTATANAQEYTLGVTSAIADTAQGAGTAGDDGIPPDGTALIGDRSRKTGLFALEDVDIFNILCIPRTAIVSGPNALTPTEASTVIAAATNYCEEQRAFFIIDTPDNVDDVQEIKEWLDDNNTLRHQNLALYFPRLKIADPQNNFRLRSIGASGTMAGLYARIDSNRGVWKAPAGTEAILRGAQALDYKLTDPQNGTLNPLGINSMRTFPVYGNVCWGARTLMGADQLASEWKYIPIRRLALFMEESLYRGTQWVVFEPNDEPLWAQIRLNVGAFMHNLYRQGAFQGSSPSVAYFVKCDGETTTQNDRDRGIVNILVGFAPLKPAEFVIISISQIAGDIQT